ncbi:MAG: hypothetical protein IJW55_09435 [Clostridia bacterium]|nr:hypothetical protein [Clostridia bacterium]
MGFWTSLIIALVIVLGIVLFFAPLIIICQLSDIKQLLRKIGTHMDENHDELMNAKNDTEPKQNETNEQRQDELMKSLFQDEKNTSDQ